MATVRSALCLLAGLALAGALLDHAAVRAQPAPAAVTVPAPGGDVTVIADRLEEIGPDNLLIATGNVEITRGTARLTADRVEIDRETGAAVATGRVVFYDGDDRLTGERIDYNLKTGTGVVHDARAHASPYYRIAGERMERLDPSVYRVRRGIFTTCEDDPPAWSFRFGEATADLEDILYGTGASFWVRSVPVVPFIPFFAAPIRRERQTGFLFPRFGSSSRKGLFAEIPFFWAISDSQDATITFDAYEKRGFGLGLEYRYVLSSTNQGMLRGFFIKETQRDDPETETGEEVPTGRDDNRGWVSFKHEWLPGAGLGFRADINAVTDDFVFKDYGDPLPERSAQRVESNVFLTRSWPTWNLVGNLFWYQDLTTRRPVELQRLPEIRLQGVRQPLPGDTGILYEVESSAVNFVRDVGSDGARVDVFPRLARPVPVFGFFTLTPFVAGRLTGYETGVTGTRTTRGVTVEVTDGDPRVRRLVELGSDFEARAARVFDLGGFAGVDAVLHSIEPRVKYTWRDGSDLVRFRRDGATRGTRLPQWDSIDAVAETSAFTYSLTNRIRARTVAPEGTEPVRWELVRFTLGHSYELLNEDRPLGNVTGDLIIDPNRVLRFRADASYNVYGEGLKTANTDLSVSVPRLTASVGTRTSREEVVVDPAGSRQSRTTVSFLQGNLTAELTRNLAARLSTNWDTRADVFVENRVALDFKWQCWAFTLEYVSRRNDEDELRFALNLLGVGAPITTGTRIGGSRGGAQ